MATIPSPSQRLTSAALFLALQPLLNMPKNTTRFVITAAVGEVPTIEVTYYPDVNAENWPPSAPITRRFKLVAVDGTEAAR